ncbi:hypothetical protein IscW_ISCW021380 [Ixodes scapularis]|uniref:Uncharacterized protein n=1 Tax=Ixodes scapularis TaxID=6945 RepID=B7Q8C3_IXOSC|nr:hypothetical protein IscW_ISCW021380 [Ixodes scapularis]|eukprot:XP_002412339.1 hypothetical protein IscW_ISCW021380 [Ixodes scapularis]
MVPRPRACFEGSSTRSRSRPRALLPSRLLAAKARAATPWPSRRPPTSPVSLVGASGSATTAASGAETTTATPTPGWRPRTMLRPTTERRTTRRRPPRSPGRPHLFKTSTSSPPSSQEPHRGSAPFNLSDFSSSQTLLNLVRTASAQSASQLETYLRGAVKRPHEGEQARADPLDLSVGTAVKRPRSTDSPRSASKGDVDGATVAASPSRKQATSPWLLLDGRGSSKSPKLRCGSVCSDQASPCAAAEASPQGVAKWTVDEVVHFVASVDSCQEYAEVSCNILILLF